MHQTGAQSQLRYETTGFVVSWTFLESRLGVGFCYRPRVRLEFG